MLTEISRWRLSLTLGEDWGSCDFDLPSRELGCPVARDVIPVFLCRSLRLHRKCGERDIRNACVGDNGQASSSFRNIRSASGRADAFLRTFCTRTASIWQRDLVFHQRVLAVIIPAGGAYPL